MGNRSGKPTIFDPVGYQDALRYIMQPGGSGGMHSKRSHPRRGRSQSWKMK